MIKFFTTRLLQPSIKLLVSGLLVSLLGACSSMPQPVRNLVKSDIDFVIDAHVQEQVALIEELMRKLYVRNPGELKKSAIASTVEERIFSILGNQDSGTLPELEFSELNKLQGINAINLGLMPDWQGDRVFAVIAGLTGMMKTSYNSKTEFYMFDSLDQQSLYNSARNIEILNWKIRHRLDDKNTPLLLTNQHSKENIDTSFDRLFTRMTSLQDMMAKIVASKNDRSINTVVFGIAQTFFPIGI